jgi:BirA family biotin operon repressor/biotin-[acetyl-CoA-carboxylase] ligase
MAGRMKDEMTSALESTANWALQRKLALISEAQTGSTNDDAKRNAFQERSDLALYLASHQTAGRGRGKNTWLDTGSGDSLLSTWSFFIADSPQAITAPRVGLALFRAASQVWPHLPWAIKAPNDLFLGGLKVGGLLIETVSNGSHHRLIIGLGFNVLNHPRKFTTATHLAAALSERPKESEWFRFLDELRDQFERARLECVMPELSASCREELVRALNANPNRAVVIKDVSPAGDLIHEQGTVRWTDL